MAIATRSKPPIHARKRQAGHHRHSKPYLKTYWPYLPMLLIVIVGLIVNTKLTASQHVLGAANDFSQATLINATNAARASAHEAPLTIDPQLTQAAIAKATDMAQRNYWSHNTPDGKTPWSFDTAAGYSYSVAGENLAYGFGDASATVKGWMNSAEHRANILDAEYQNVGFGVAAAPNYLGKGPAVIVVAEYAQPSTAVASISFTVPTHEVKGSQTSKIEPVASMISRVQLWTGQASWILLVLAAVSGSALTLFLVRHARKFHRYVTKSEKFVAHHPWLDIAMVFIVTVGFVLSRSSGFIR